MEAATHLPLSDVSLRKSSWKHYSIAGPNIIENRRQIATVSSRVLTSLRIAVKSLYSFRGPHIIENRRQIAKESHDVTARRNYGNPSSNRQLRKARHEIIQQGMPTNQQGTASNQQGTASNRQGTASNQQGTASNDRYSITHGITARVEIKPQQPCESPAISFRMFTLFSSNNCQNSTPP